VAKLLIVDDDTDTLAWVSAALGGLGHETRAFANARDALAALEEWTPDLIVSDILMPEIDGLTFTRLARRVRGAPVMFISIAKQQAAAILAGAVGFVQKPATAAEVRAAVTRVLGQGDRKNVILVVDDDPDIRYLYRSFLEPRFTVFEAEDGRRGLEELRARPIDLAIVDVRMPVMNGIEMIRAMRDDPRLERVPVIVQTSDRNVLEGTVWTDLQVSQVIDKQTFLTWLDRQIEETRAGHAAHAPS
jgi:CheY-like chemotaxis protein